MPSFIRISIITLFTLVCFSLLTYTACVKDKCNAVSCLNGGVCRDGACACNAEYTGQHCETRVLQDPCANISCQNGGTCDSGYCTCPSLYEGTYCQDKIRDKFVGAWRNVHSSTIMTIDTAAYPTQVYIRNNDLALSEFTATIVKSKTISFAGNPNGGYTSGTLTLSASDTIIVDAITNDGSGPYHEGGTYYKMQ